MLGNGGGMSSAVFASSMVVGPPVVLCGFVVVAGYGCEVSG